MSEATTRGVRVRVRARHVPEQSDPARGEWLFAYTVVITNDGEETVQLLHRHWFITDANGETNEVRGPGVVGAQPVLKRGESFEYTSACPLKTPFGMMQGTYLMELESGGQFNAEIAPFKLHIPYAVN